MPWEAAWGGWPTSAVPACVARQVKLEALYAGLKDKVQFKKITEKYPKKIEKIKNVNMQLKVIYDTDENELTQEIIELAEELIVKK